MVLPNHRNTFQYTLQVTSFGEVLHHYVLDSKINVYLQIKSVDLCMLQQSIPIKKKIK